MALELPPLYAILDPEQTRGCPAERVLTGLLEAGVSILQLRVKSLPPVDFLELAKDARTATRAHNCKLIINDRIDIAPIVSSMAAPRPSELFICLMYSRDPKHLLGGTLLILISFVEFASQFVTWR